jgi:hypothetical protein
MPVLGKRPNVFAAPQAKAYRPTMRDQAGSLLSNVLGNTYQGNRIARNVFGSSGLGGGQGNLLGGLGILDLTPIGAAFALEEAGRQIGGGQPVTGAANVALGMVPIPAVAKGGKAVVRSAARRVAGKAAKAAPAPKPGFVAYHGSPHTFDQFDTAKIGTGEGAQAYGHGLYFAEQEAVARNYRDALTNKRVPDGEHIDKVAFNVVRAGPDMPDAELAPFIRNVYPDASDERVRQALSTARANQQAGSMYQVRINADPNDFLDWDRPLSEQSERVRRAFSHEGNANLPGSEAYHRLQDAAVSNKILPNAPIDTPLVKLQAQHLRDAGVPGIRYLDQGSRGAGEGSRNFVVFDPRIIDIMKRYGVAAPVAAAILAGTMQPPKGKEPGA